VREGVAGLDGLNDGRHSGGALVGGQGRDGGADDGGGRGLLGQGGGGGGQDEGAGGQGEHQAGHHSVPAVWSAASASREEKGRRSRASRARASTSDSGWPMSASSEREARSVAAQQSWSRGRRSSAEGVRLTMRSRPSLPGASETQSRAAIWEMVWLTAEWLTPMRP